MATEKISLSMDIGAMLLARRAAEIEGMSLSAWMSRLVQQHAWASQRPRLAPDQQAQADKRATSLDEPPCSAVTGSGVRRGELWRSPSSLRDRVILLVSS